MFQFYLSSIKSYRMKYDKEQEKSFNSTLVQLKVYLLTNFWHGEMCFNSTLVQLKVFLVGTVRAGQ